MREVKIEEERKIISEHEESRRIGREKERKKK